MPSEKEMGVMGPLFAAAVASDLAAFQEALWVAQRAKLNPTRSALKYEGELYKGMTLGEIIGARAAEVAGSGANPTIINSMPATQISNTYNFVASRGLDVALRSLDAAATTVVRPVSGRT